MKKSLKNLSLLLIFCFSGLFFSCGKGKILHIEKNEKKEIYFCKNDKELYSLLKNKAAFDGDYKHDWIEYKYTLRDDAIRLDKDRLFNLYFAEKFRNAIQSGYYVVYDYDLEEISLIGCLRISNKKIKGENLAYGENKYKDEMINWPFSFSKSEEDFFKDFFNGNFNQKKFDEEMKKEFSIIYVDSDKSWTTL